MLLTIVKDKAALIQRVDIKSMMQRPLKNKLLKLNNNNFIKMQLRLNNKSSHTLMVISLLMRTKISVMQTTSEALNCKTEIPMFNNLTLENNMIMDLSHCAGTLLVEKQMSKNWTLDPISLCQHAGLSV